MLLQSAGSMRRCFLAKPPATRLLRKDLETHRIFG
jgi:hypothetical protein